MKDPVCLDPVCLDPVESNIPYVKFTLTVFCLFCSGAEPGFQVFGGVPGEDFDMQNPNLKSKCKNQTVRAEKLKFMFFKSY